MFSVKDWAVKKGMAAADFAAFVKSQADVKLDSLEYVTEEWVLAKTAKGSKAAAAKSGGAKSGGAKSGGAAKKRKAAAEPEE